mgnify:CR=1 FL=1
MELESGNERVALEFVRPVDIVVAGILTEIIDVAHMVSEQAKIANSNTSVQDQDARNFSYYLLFTFGVRTVALFQGFDSCNPDKHFFS